MQGFSSRVMRVAAVAALLCQAAASAHAQADDRSVTIIEGAPEPVPDLPPPANAAPPPTLRAANPAGVSVDILPNADLHVGTRIAFRVTTQQPGYLILVDINAAGKMTQIFPNMMSISRWQGSPASANLIKPGVKVTIPDVKNPLARFQFVAEPPLGHGVVIAILSDRPVQIIDLPELPAQLDGQQAMVDFLYTTVQDLKITSADDNAKVVPGVWSFDAKGYELR